jgi:hypothetical protein
MKLKTIMPTKFWLEILKERDFLENPCVDSREMLNLITKKYDERIWTGFVWLSKGADGGLL